VALSFFMLVFCSFYVATIDTSVMGNVIFSFDFFDTDFFVLATGISDLKILIFAIIIGTMVGLMRLTDSMSGQEAHIANGEKSISVRFGLDGAVKIAKVLSVFVYVLAAVMVYFNPVYVLLFLSLPLILRAFKIMAERGEYWCLKSSPFFFGAAFFTEILFIAAAAVILLFEVGSLF
jgi:1,4-dihydroxy-2-naphthoate octaprenyltransferase